MGLPEEDLAPFRARVADAQDDVERFTEAVRVLVRVAPAVRTLADPARATLTPEAWSGPLADEASGRIDGLVRNLGLAGDDLDAALVVATAHRDDAEAELATARQALREVMGH